MKNNKSKILFTGQIELQSPLLIGCGNNENSDIDVLLDSNGNPFIPATSFIGVIRDFIKLQDNKLDVYFGTDSNVENSSQSSIKCSNLVLADNSAPKIVVRDGIRINSKTGLVNDKAKYDFEVVERQTKFEMKLVADVDDGKKDDIQRLFSFIISGLENSVITLGAKTNSGLGEVKLINYKVTEYNFSNKKDVYNWLKNDGGNKIQLPKVELKNNFDFEMNVRLKLRNSLIVKSYPGSPELPDAVNITSNGDFVLPGTSIKGAVRARIERILNTIKEEHSEKIISNLFGNVDTNNKNSKAIKGRIKIREEILPGFIAELQSRIKIDRFTGGTINGALFDSMPLFDDTIDMNEKNVLINIEVKDCQDYEAGILMLVLKDFWTGDLAIGGEKNIGRGVFDGVSAEIKYDNKVFSVPKDINTISKELKAEMQKFVDELVVYSGGEDGK